MFRRARLASAVRPSIQSLEHRLLLSNSAIDTAYGTGGAANLTNALTATGAGTVSLLQGDQSLLVGVENTLVRMTPVGTRDNAFANNGIYTLPANLNGTISGLAVQSDGKLLVAVRRAADGDATILRLGITGQIDPTWGTAGVLSFDFAPPSATPDPVVSQLQNMRMLADGSILVAGSVVDPVSLEPVLAVAKLQFDGTFDPSFDTDGTATIPLTGLLPDAVRAIRVQADGKIVILDEVHTPLNVITGAIVQLNADGSPDINFDTDGWLRAADDDKNNLHVGDILLDSSSRILLSGENEPGPNIGFITRYNTDGTIDATFGTDGIANPPADAAGSGVSGMVFTPDGRILAAHTNHFGLYLFSADGVLDDTFTTPDAITAAAGSTASARQAYVLSDGRFLAVGDISDPVAPTIQAVSARYLGDVILHPQATFTAPPTAAENETIALTATAQTAIGRVITQYLWDLDYNGRTFTPDISGQSPVVPAYTFNGPSTRTIALRVLDSSGDSSPIITGTIDITNSAPAITATLATNPAFVHQPVTINLTALDAPGDTVASWSVDWGDGSVFTITGSLTSVSRSYSQSGDFIVHIIGTDNDGAASTEALVNVTVNPTPKLAGTVFNDANANAALGTGETRMADVTVFMDANNNNVLDEGEASTVSDATGYYFFSNIPITAGQRLRVQTPSGFRTTTPVGQPLPALSPDTTYTLDVGLTNRIFISGTIFSDNNKNGRKDPHEAGLWHWRVFIDTNGNGRLDAGETSVLTDTLGKYTLSTLTPGHALVRAIPKAGYKVVRPANNVWSLNLIAASVVKQVNFAYFHKPHA